jgi:hypothetical protein
MLRDVFYYGKKPNVHPREKPATSLDHAREQATTDHFWIINEFCDYKNFDWDFDFQILPNEDVWAEEHNNVWPSLYQKDSGTWLCAKFPSTIIIYRADVPPIKRKAIKDERWVVDGEVDASKFDFAWHPDPTEPLYIYKWGSKFCPVEIKSYIEYKTPGAVNIKYMTEPVELLPEKDRWVINQEVDTNKFDLTWRPDPREPPYIYVWGNKFIDGCLESTLEYHAPGATSKKYMDDPVPVMPQFDRWKIYQEVDSTKFDFSWRPDPREPPFIYVWGNKHILGELKPTLEYHTPGATSKKYMDEPVEVLPLDYWIEYQAVDKNLFDMSWRPDPREPPFIYVWGNKYIPGELMPTIEFHCPGAKSKKFMQEPAAVQPQLDRWNIVQQIDEKYYQNDSSGFNLTWRPDPSEPPFIYVWGNKYIPANEKSTLEYHVPGASKIKFMDELLDVAPDWDKWVNVLPIDKNKSISNGFDFTWRPDPKEPPYVYTWGNKFNDATIQPTLEYHCEGATERKYMGNNVEILPDWNNWKIAPQVDRSSFDFSWRPDPTSPPFIYVFGNQHYDGKNMPTVEYHVPGAKNIKYIDDIRAELLPNSDRYEHLDYCYGIDYSWVPNPNDPPYIYAWGNQWNKPEDKVCIQYRVIGATDYKYMTQRAIRKPTMDNWIVPANVDTSEFDFSWEPNPKEPPYIYQFGTQWQKTGGPKYVVPGATEVKYVDTLKAKALPDKNRYSILENYKIKDFDYSWHPDATEPPYIYIFGNNYYPAQKMPTIKYTVPGATEIKYIISNIATLDSDKTNWISLLPVDETKFDYSWIPDPNEPPYIYVFGNKWNDPYVEPTMEYRVKNATEKKYIDFLRIPLLPDPALRDNWFIPNNLDTNSFDFSWRPDPREPALIYQFGTQHQKTNGPKFVVEGGTEIKYVSSVKAKMLPNKQNWETIDNIEVSEFDYSWHPDDTEEPYIYVFGNTQYPAEVMPTIRYCVPGATTIKYINDIVAKLAPNKQNWIIPDNVDVSDFDFSWRPNPKDPPYIYQFGTQWQKTGGPRYVVPNASELKYVDTLKAIRLPVMDNWVIPLGIDVSTFDFSWHPDDTAPHAVYQFGTLENDNDGPRYMAIEEKFNTIDDLTTFDNADTLCGEGFSNIKIDYPVIRLLRTHKQDTTYKVKVNKYQIRTTLEELIDEHPHEVFWALNKNIDYAKFDFSWRPNIEQARYIHVFGSPDSKATHTYFISAKMFKQGYKDYNFIEKDKKADSEYLSKLFKKNDMFFIDRGNSESSKRFEELSKKYSNLQKTRFLNTWVDTVNRCIKRASTQLIWILNSELDYTDFDFDYYPNPWQFKMVHIFGTQWNHWGTTFLINCETFPEDTKYVKIIEHLQNINFVKDRRVKTTNNLYDIYLIDHGNNETEKVYDILSKKVNDRKIHKVKFNKDYFNTLKTLLNNIPDKKENYIWLCNSICDYTNFDFSYVPDPFARDNLHVFPSNKQKFGDTFLIDVNTVKELIEYMNELNEYTKLNFNNHQKVSRLPAPVFTQKTDTHVGGLDVEFDFPYAIFKTEEVESVEDEPISFWSNESKNILITSTGATQIMIPKEAKDYVKKELYDYPYIKTVSKVSKSKPLDIVFLSNGEKQAESNYQHLLRCVAGCKNKVVRVDGVNGRVQAYHAAANASETAWMFTVFAKLRIDKDFDWDWQPDRLQIAKHYIFNAYNPLNDLEYGHQGMIAYNKNLVLNNKGLGLDFTLDDPHESVNILSGIANFNTDPYSTWRTAFREVIKLKSAYDDVSKERLKVWLINAKGEYSKHCLLGAHDAVEYYQSVHGDITQLKLSYEWKWLQDYYNKKYK